MKKIIIPIIIVLVLVAGIYYWQNKSDNSLSVNKDTAPTTSKDVYLNDATTEPTKNISQYQYTEKYSHPTNHFSFNYPKGFTVTSIPSEEIETIIVQNTTTKVAVQITISPFQGEDIDITPEIIKTDIPDMKVDNAQELTVGQSRKGLAFISDNPAFGGKSSEIWFVFQGNLYQMSTYYEFDIFLKGIFATWTFTK